MIKRLVIRIVRREYKNILKAQRQFGAEVEGGDLEQSRAGIAYRQRQSSGRGEEEMSPSVVFCSSFPGYSFCLSN